MEIWLDTTDKEIIIDALERGILHGVTTNPSLVARSGKKLEDIIDMLLDIQDGPIAVQVLATDKKEMIDQAELLTSNSPRVIVKIPVSNQGLLVINHLAKARIPVMATAVFAPYQALLAFKAGAHYIAPYVGRIEDKGVKAMEVLQTMQTVLENYLFDTKILAAGIRDVDTILECADLGLAAITLNDKIYKQFVEDNRDTMEAIEKFSQDWRQGQQSTLIPY